MKKLISLILSMILCASLAVPALAAGVTFSDVPQTYWGYTQIERAFADGVIAGTYYNEKTGERQFSPEGTVTMAQFVVIMTRAFYNDEVNASTATGTWYAQHQEVANKHDLLNGLGTVVMGSAATRYQMAVVMRNIMEDQGAEMPSATEISATSARIADWNSIPTKYRDAVATVFYLKIITGTDDKGTFNGSGEMKRSHAAVIYGRLRDAIDTLTDNPGTGSNTGTGTQTGNESTTKPTTPTTNSVVGTISKSKVTLSTSTHAPVYDWWSTLPADVRAVTDKDAMNGIWQSAHDWKTIMNEGAFGTKFNTKRVNEYYNYAVYSPSGANHNTVSSAVSVVETYNVSIAETMIPSTSVYAGLVFENSSKAKLDPIFKPILAKINNSMTDKEKVQICVKAITDRFEYGTMPGVAGCTWTNGNTYGVCEDFTIITSQLLSAAGIPVITCTGDTALGAHGWNIALIDGEWLVVDSTAAEAGYSMPMTYAQHAKLYGYSTDRYKASVTPANAAARAIAEMFAEMGIYD